MLVEVFRKRVDLILADGTELERQKNKGRVVKEKITHHDAVPLSLLDLLAVQSEMIRLFVQGKRDDRNLV